MQTRASLLAWIGAACVCAALSLAPSSAQAETSLGPHMGINFDWDEVFIGGELRTDVAELSPTVQLQLNPSLSLAFPGRGVIFDMSFNVPFQFYVRDSVLRPFTGPGLALVDHTGGGHADLFLNLIGGLLFDLGNVDPFLQLKVMIPHHAAVELMGGVLFRL